MKILNKYILTITFNCLIPLFIIPMLSSSLYSQQQVGFILKGKVYSSATRKPVDFATVIVLEAKRKARTQEDGSYEITVPETGEYTIIVRSSGMKMFKTKIKISRDLNRNFTLMPISIKGAALTIIGERDIQKVSRRTMTVEDLKETPASFGDSINALSSLPGVDRTDGFFGPLVIRGMYPDRNRYYIDGMPINNPMHFGGIHSVINNNLMSEVDLYASAFPSQFGGPLAAVIDINTQDTVKEFGGYTDIGIISASALVQTPITRSVINGEEIKEENAGYLITSGRYGYLSLIVPYIIEMTTDNDVEFAPEYYDYQVKGKYYINDHNSISILFIGSFDKMKFLTSEDAVDEDEGEDPLVNDFELQSDEMFNNFGFYYTYQLDRLKNRVMLYASLSRHIFHMKSGQEDIADWIKDFNQNVKPYIYGIKNDFNIEWWERRSMLRGNIEYTLYHFTATGNSIIDNSAEEGFDIADNDRVRVEELDLKFVNHSMGGYLDNKFTLGGLIFVPGVRFDYYFRSKETTVDPRGMISYEFSTDTTISAAGGQYSSHFQLNPFLFYVIPEVCDMYYADPENSYHTVIGIEQVIGLYTFGIEFYYNYFKNIAWGYPHYNEDGEYRMGLNSGKVKVKGFEIMIRKDQQKGSNDYFGWMSYTYNRSEEKKGLLGNRWIKNPITGEYEESAERFDPTGHMWLTSDQEREHSYKLVIGYKFASAHTISFRFQLYSPFAYTPIIGSEESPPDSGRYVPVYNVKKNTEHFDIDHRLDFRYTYRTNYEWGYVSWYIEMINVYGQWHNPVVGEEWSYNEPYKKGENPSAEREEGLPYIPNFGVEVKF